MLRESCGKCHFTNTKRPSDITIADYWGWERTDTEFNKDDKGVSLILVNTNKGHEIFNTIKDSITVIPAKIANCLQNNLQRPSLLHPKRMTFENEYTKKGFEYVMKRYGKYGWKKKLYRLFSRIKRKVKQTFDL